MIVSEARSAANRLNSLKSTGPRSPETKAISARNSLKHGLTGEGIVVPEGDREAIERRVMALEADMQPRSPAGILLILQMATLSVRAERAAEQEIAATASRVRNAAEAFDEERLATVNALFEALGDDLRNNLRKLRKAPEGVERMHEAWHDLRDELTMGPDAAWSTEDLELAAHLEGVKARHARGSRLGALSRAVHGDFAALTDEDGAGLDDEARKAWARSALIERVDAALDELAAHYATLDFETIAIDRADAGTRALFDPSKGATLARRYESEARRGFFNALKEFRRVEAESEAQAAADPAFSTPSRMASSRETPPTPAREPIYGYDDAPGAPIPARFRAEATVPTPRQPVPQPG